MGKPYTNEEQYEKDRKAEARLNSRRNERQLARWAKAVKKADKVQRGR